MPVTEWIQRTHTSRPEGRPRRAVVGITLAVVAAATLSCGAEEERVHSIGYAIDNTVTTYNANTVDGAASGARQAFTRVLPGFGYVAPSGYVVSDTDIGTATAVPGDPFTVQYRLSPDSVYSDGVPMSCDDLVLTWAAGSGRFSEPDESGATVNVFDSSLRGGYADIERVECQPGSKEATVVFKGGRGDADWNTLFGATELMPAHVAARQAGVGDLVGAINGGNLDEVRRIADFWNTGWSLTPGEFDAALFPSAGPYRVESYTTDGGLVLVANERWWGNAPGTDRIVVWSRGSEMSAAADSGQIQVVDVGAGSMSEAHQVVGAVESATVVSRNLEQIVFATRGVFENPAARRAFALCVPRTQLFEELGASGAGSGFATGPVSSRLLPTDSPLYPQTAGPAERYLQPDLEAARGERSGSGQERMEVRIGYLAPDDRRARTVELIAASCREAGIDVVDAGSDSFVPSQLGNEVDAVLAGTAAAAGSGGTADMDLARAALHSGTGSNIGGFANGRIDEILDGLLVAGDLQAVAGLVGDGERILWEEMPTLPLFVQPRSIGFASGLSAGVANPTTAGSGWNMDRWILTE